MKKILFAISLILTTSIVFAEFTESDYATLVSVKKRVEAVRDAQIVINKTITAVKQNAAEINGYLTTIGAADSLITQDLIDEITGIMNKLNTGANNIENNHKVFLTGSGD